MQQPSPPLRHHARTQRFTLISPSALNRPAAQHRCAGRAVRRSGVCPDIGGKTQLGLGLGLLSFTKTTTDPDSDAVDEIETTSTSFGTLESSTVTLGYGVSNHFVIGVDVAATFETRSQDNTDDVTTTGFSVAPVASYVFSGSTLRPFLSASVGVATASSDLGDVETTTTVFGLILATKSDAEATAAQLRPEHLLGERERAQLASARHSEFGRGAFEFRCHEASPARVDEVTTHSTSACSAAGTLACAQPGAAGRAQARGVCGVSQRPKVGRVKAVSAPARIRQRNV
jgi:hypothetical protein